MINYVLCAYCIMSYVTSCEHFIIELLKCLRFRTKTILLPQATRCPLSQFKNTLLSLLQTRSSLLQVDTRDHSVPELARTDDLITAGPITLVDGRVPQRTRKRSIDVSENDINDVSLK